MKFRFLTLLSAVALLFYLAKTFCDAQTDGFSVARIHSEFAPSPEWQIEPLETAQREQLREILSQPFHYLACGGQAFAFASHDGRYVIKFFKHRFRKPYSYLYPYLSEKKLQKSLLKMRRDFTSYKLAYEELKEESGLVYIHLNKDVPLDLTAHITDKLGISHEIPLNDVEFVLQKRAVLAYDYIDTLVQEQNLPKLRAGFAAILKGIVSRCEKGIFDEDPKIHRNLGFIEEAPIFIDVGRFVRDDQRKNPDIYREDLRLIMKRFRHWLEECHPELVDLLDEEMKIYA